MKIKLKHSLPKEKFKNKIKFMHHIYTKKNQLMSLLNDKDIFMVCLVDCNRHYNEIVIPMV